MCPHCETEVELEWEMEPQVCPSCGKWIQRSTPEGAEPKVDDKSSQN